MATETPAFTIRSAASVEEVSALWWPLMQDLGWNRAEADCHTHYTVAQNGENWLLVIPEKSGKPEGCLLALIYPNSTGWIAFFILNASSRGQGLGRELWKEMDLTFRRAATTTIGLDGVQEQYDTYRRRGFESAGKIHILARHALKGKPTIQPLDLTGAVELQDLRDADPKELAKLDYEHTGLDRSAYWATGLLVDRMYAFGFAILSPKNDRLTGFIYVRRCENGHRFGPLYAETYAQAKQLLHKAMNNVSASQGCVAEIFGNNSEGRRAFEELGWVDEGMWYHRMWLDGRVPEEQKQGGKGVKGMYAIFDAAAG
ncbi:hypothetical protein EJ02DRAFT_467472 [Clathrospora elynae]|uniref:N-acetyltransferase domain-containing protein n=1 Tax=Clathrospora elynae TaxID=706981 RepID=A0A6A5SI47_9PLEO|nr:hypothetical protein EJ02DRAFT_467472 [Clathrospora elynae]